MKWMRGERCCRAVRHLLRFCVVAVFSGGFAHIALAQGSETSPSSMRGNDVGRQWVEHAIAPAIQHFAQQSRKLHSHFEHGCPHGDARWLNEASKAFESVVTAWSSIAFLRFGPLVENNRYERLSFWPDPRGVMLRQVSGVLAQYENGKPIAPLSQSSVAIQGLPALEYVLYRENGVLNASLSADERVPLCRYAIDLTENIVSVSEALTHSWSLPDGDYAQYFAFPGNDNPVYRNPQEVIAEGVKAISTGLQFVRDIQLAPPLMGTETEVSIKKAPYWRSGLTGSAIAATLSGIRRFVAASELLPVDQQWIVIQIEAELGRAAQRAVDLNGAAATTPLSLRQNWMLVGQIVDNAKDLTDADLASALGVSVGFNALDGD